MNTNQYLAIVKDQSLRTAILVLAEYYENPLAETLPGFSPTTTSQNIAYEIGVSVKKSTYHQQANLFFSMIDIALGSASIKEEHIKDMFDVYLSNLLGNVFTYTDGHSHPVLNAFYQIQAEVCKEMFNALREYSAKYSVHKLK
ncbi:MAG TPA: hypothetical protein PLB74_03095 [Candidatus Paceibacterota bacterium]|jgi:hypothetical protein|nr:hypothetical protein [Candidatus Paceibacterota bacterium]